MSTLKSINVIHPSSAVNNIVNDASGNVAVGNNLTVAGTATVGGVAAVAVAPGTNGNVLTSNGTAWTSAAPSGGGLPTPSAIGQIPFSTNGSTYAATQKITQGTAQASTSGTSIDFTSIPSWVKRVTVMFNGVSTSGTSPVLIQIGSGSVTTSGYTSGAFVGLTSGAGAIVITSSAGFTQSLQTGDLAAAARFGSCILSLLGSNFWASTGGLIGGSYAASTMGGVALGGALDRVRITTVNGTDTFDAGSINIMYE
jgi:hypothetical protein